MKKAYRVKKEREFQKVFQEGASFANRNFVVYRLAPSEQPHFRVGLSVGKKIGNAVARNRIKRQVRAALQEIADQIDPAVDFIVIARPALRGRSYVEIRSNLIHVLRLAQVIKNRKEIDVREEKTE